MNKAVTLTGFMVAIIGAGIAAGTLVPVAYGAGEATPGVTGTGILGTLMTILGGATGLISLFKNSSTSEFLKNSVTHIASGDGTASIIDGAFVTIAAAILSKKGNIDPVLMSDLGELRKKIDVSIAPIKP